MANADFHWNVRGGRPRSGGIQIAPGDRLDGSLTITPQSDLPARGVQIRLQWRTEGRGDRDTRTVNTLRFTPEALAAGQPEAFGFRFDLPRYPWSYSGHYITIVWELIAEIDLPMAFNPKDAFGLVLRPTEA